MKNSILFDGKEEIPKLSRALGKRFVFRYHAPTEDLIFRAVAQLASALALGARGRGFEPHQPDHKNRSGNGSVFVSGLAK